MPKLKRALVATLLFLCLALSGCGGCQRDAGPVVDDGTPKDPPQLPTKFKYKDYNVILVSFDALQGAHFIDGALIEGFANA